MSRFSVFLLLLLILHSASSNVEGIQDEGVHFPYLYRKMNIRDRMVLENILHDYTPSGPNKGHDPPTKPRP